MWCRDCQQDVPGVATSEAGRYVCPRCGEPVAILAAGSPGLAPTHQKTTNSEDSSKAHACKKRPPSGRADSHCECGTSEPPPHACSCPVEASAEGKEPVVTIVPEPPPLPDGWELEEQLRHIERVLKADKLSGQPAATPDQGQWMRLDAAHGTTPDWHRPVAKQRTSAAANRGDPPPRRHNSWAAAFSWAMLSLGSMALCFAGVLLGWSMVTGRDDLWAIGMPVLLVGQLALLGGFILQLDRLWRSSREASTKLDDVDEQIGELKATTSLLGTTHSSPAASFYSHMAGGAHPQLLLVDLKNQLDLLSIRLSQIDR